MDVLLLIPEALPPERWVRAETGLHPQRDCDALAAAIRSLPHGHAEILDYGAVDRSRNLLVSLVRRLAGYDWALALLAVCRCSRYDAVFSQAIVVGKRFALLSAVLPRRPRHVTQAFCVTAGHRWIWFRLLAVQREMDLLIFFAREQYDAARTRLRIAEHKLLLLENGFVDTVFFRPHPGDCARANQLCAVGQTHRDYHTLLSAAAPLPHLTLRIDAGSPSSHPSRPVGLADAPQNVEFCRLEMGTVRQLYAESAAVVVPLHPNPIGAGLTTVLEAMAMGKPVIVTRSAAGTFAGREQFRDGENVLLVDAADVEGLRQALLWLMSDGELRGRLGRNARRWVEQHASRDFVQQLIISGLQGIDAPDRRSQTS